MRAITFSAVLVCGLVSGACSAIVAAQLSKTDAEQAAVPPDPCSLTSTSSTFDTQSSIDASAIAACAGCIEQNCKSNVTYACNASGTPKMWFTYLKQCAQNPVESSSFGTDYSCGRYDKPDNQPIAGMDDSAEERSSEICVYKNCLTQPTPPCHQCAITTDKTGSSGETASLDDSPCGQCLRAACGPTLVQCCDKLPSGFSDCAFTNDPMKQASCASLYDAGAPPPDGSTDNFTPCAYAVQSKCFTTQCQSACGPPPAK